MFNTKGGRIKYIMSKDLELCEGFGQYKKVVIIERAYYYRRILLNIFYPHWVYVQLLVLSFGFCFIYCDWQSKKTGVYLSFCFIIFVSLISVSCCCEIYFR